MVTPLHPVPGGPPSTPRPLAWQDGRVLPADQATVPLTDDGVLRGDAVRDSVLVHGGRTHARERHLSRLRASARTLGLRVPVLTRCVEDLLAAWGEHDGLLTVVVTRGGLVRGLLVPRPRADVLSLSAVLVPWRTPLSGVPTVSCAMQQWASRQARAAEADDALVLDPDGTVLELPTASLVVVADGVLSTPDPDVLPIVRSVSVDVLGEIVEITPALLTLEDVRAADELFAVSAAGPLRPVHALDDVAFPAPGPVAERLLTELDDHIAATLD